MTVERTKFRTHRSELVSTTTDTCGDLSGDWRTHLRPKQQCWQGQRSLVLSGDEKPEDTSALSSLELMWASWWLEPKASSLRWPMAQSSEYWMQFLSDGHKLSLVCMTTVPQPGKRPECTSQAESAPLPLLHLVLGSEHGGLDLCYPDGGSKAKSPRLPAPTF